MASASMLKLGASTSSFSGRSVACRSSPVSSTPVRPAVVSVEAKKVCQLTGKDMICEWGLRYPAAMSLAAATAAAKRLQAVELQSRSTATAVVAGIVTWHHMPAAMYKQQLWQNPVVAVLARQMLAESRHSLAVAAADAGAAVQQQLFQFLQATHQQGCLDQLLSS